MIVGDSSALIALAIMDRLDLLETLFSQVYVPQAVYDEVIVGDKAQSTKLKAFLAGKVIRVQSNVYQMGLGEGELEAIALYRELGAELLLIDDKRAKSFARLNDVKVIGSLGVLILAKEQGLIPTVKDDIEALERSDVYVSGTLIRKVLQLVGE